MISLLHLDLFRRSLRIPSLCCKLMAGHLLLTEGFDEVGEGGLPLGNSLIRRHHSSFVHQSFNLIMVEVVNNQTKIPSLTHLDRWACIFLQDRPVVGVEVDDLLSEYISHQ